MLKTSSIIFKFAVLALVLGFYSFDAMGTWGSLDTTFGSGGIAYDSATNAHMPRSVTLQPDDKILVTGYRTAATHGRKMFFLRRYMPNGLLDTAFGTNGAANIPLTSFNDQRGAKILVLPNNKIAVVGYAGGSYAVWQFNSNGTADTGFGSSGIKVLTNFPADPEHYPEINLQNRKILLSVVKYVTPTEKRVALLRLTSTGALDTTFSSNGESVTNVAGNTHTQHGTVIEADQKITIGGNMDLNSATHGLERKLSNGADDHSFLPPSIPSPYGVRPGLAKMVNGKYVMRGGGFNPQESGSTLRLVLEKYSSAGIFEMNFQPQHPVAPAWCPNIFTNQNDGKLIVEWNGYLYRTNAEIDQASLEYINCSNLNGVDYPSQGALRPDDRLVWAGVFNGSMVLVQVMGN